ncbi:cytochrome c oxidase assembly protein [Arthrobacter sp. A2-55]|uniref:cytochrome c oxidase assembly protein n=1 Tax=Arthrobacter sp. A2-55 TaxID=2897337 RepID=UPI0021CD3F3C|nr:cytochrome c oxidase assembly protein [Arthrobacter sp. A2-55]MCU6481907.1 cytochrome c oxidase assembly protein [Arthrobacter sp. A2-55]
MPPISEFWSTWSLDPRALALVVGAGGLYSWGLARAARAGIRWPLWRAAAFFVMGLGLYSVANFGFLGTWSTELRWAFSMRIAVMLFVVPAGLALGLPVGLARLTVRPGRLRTVLAAAARRPMKFFANSAVAPVVGLVVLSMMLTPLAGMSRLSPVLEGVLSIFIPLLGLLMVLPMVEEQTKVSTAVIMLEFVFAFIELLADAVPGIVMRLTPAILDGAAAFSGPKPAWFPSSIVDQQLGGDFLWFIAEVMDLPVMVLLFIRFSKSDKGERKVLDELTDEQMDELNAAHLHLRN